MPEPQEEKLAECGACGAVIYPEHITKGLAEQVDDKLLCVHCAKERHAAAGGGEAILLEDSHSSAFGLTGGVVYDKRPTAIKSFGGGPGGMTEGAAAHEERLKRPLLRDVPLATRCKIFHCKLSDSSFAYLSDQINEWADGREDVQIKFATTTIGVVEGKHADAHLIVTVFY